MGGTGSQRAPELPGRGPSRDLSHGHTGGCSQGPSEDEDTAAALERPLCLKKDASLSVPVGIHNKSSCSRAASEP